ncbi:MAG: hypothetical protein ACYC6L_17825 [Anaerolineae bacterium]
MAKKTSVIEDVTKILTAYALTKFTANALKVIGPVQEQEGYRWRIVSTRYKDITVLARTKARFLQKPGLSEITVFGTTQARTLQPNLADLRDYLETAELVQL